MASVHVRKVQLSKLLAYSKDCPRFKHLLRSMVILGNFKTSSTITQEISCLRKSSGIYNSIFMALLTVALTCQEVDHLTRQRTKYAVLQLSHECPMT